MNNFKIISRILIFFLAQSFIAQHLLAQTYSWQNVNLQGMGYVTGIISHPISKDVYARTDVGGIYRWDASIIQWLPITDGKISAYNVEGIAVNPTKAEEVFITTGNKENGKLYKSTDKGQSWLDLRGFNAFVAGNDIWRNAGPRLSVDANNRGLLMFYASRKNGLQRSTDSGQTWQTVSNSNLPFGIEANGGQNFVLIDRTSGNTYTSSNLVYVGVSGYGIYKSTDGGNSFTAMTGGPDPAINFPVCADMDSYGSLFVTYTTKWDGGDGLVYQYSTNGTGNNITPIPANGSGFAGIDVCDSDPNLLVTFSWKWGWKNNDVQGIYYSTDGGKSWSSRSFLSNNINDPAWWDTNNGLMYTWSGGAMFDPVDPKKVWFTHGYGVMTALDITKPNPVYDFPMKGLEELVAMQVFTVPSPDVTGLFAAVADVRGFVVKNKTQVPVSALDNGSFGMTSCFDYCVADPNFIVRVGDSELYWQSQGFGFKSANGGTNWSAFTTKPANAAHGNIAISANDKNRWVWAPINYSGCGWNVLPHFTTNGGASWSQSSGIPAGDNDCTEEWTASRFLAADRVNGSTFYYYTYHAGTAKFFRSENSGQSFSQITNISLPGHHKMKMEAIPGKEGNLLLCTFNGSGLYKTTNGGSSWATVTTVDKAYRFGFGKAIGTSKEFTWFLYGIVNGNEGLYYSTDLGTTWVTINSGNIPAGCIDLTGDYNEEFTVYLATAGRGIIYGTNSAATSVQLLPHSGTKDSLLKVFPNPASSQFNVSFNSDQAGKAFFSVYNTSGKLVFSNACELSSGINTLHFLESDLNLSNGLYLLKIQKKQHAFQGKILITNNKY